MKTNFLFPNQFKIFGWILFVPSLILGIVLRIFDIEISDYVKLKVFAFYERDFMSKDFFFKWIENGFLDEIILVSIIFGGILVGFSKLKTEDEFIAKIRYESLVWATYFNFGFLVFSTLFVFGGTYFDIMIVNIFSMLFFFIVRFHYMIFKLQKIENDDE